MDEPVHIKDQVAKVIAKAEQQAKIDAAGASGRLRATPFLLPNETDIPAREWLYGRHLIRRFVSVTVAPGGVGKSSLVLAEALALSTGISMLGHQIDAPRRVWLWNLEDPLEEITRRIAATCKHYRIAKDAIADRLFVDSGRDTECPSSKIYGQMAA